MKVRRISITLPARLRATAAGDARAIAEAAAEALHQGRHDAGSMRIVVQGHQQSGAGLARTVASTVRARTKPKGGG